MVKFGKFKWNPGGYKEVKNSGVIQSDLKRRAEAVARTANSRVKDNGYIVEPVTGRKAGDIIHIVHASSYESATDNARNNTLRKSLGSAK